MVCSKCVKLHTRFGVWSTAKVLRKTVDDVEITQQRQCTHRTLVAVAVNRTELDLI